MQKVIKKNKGFTLIELIVALGIMAILMVPISAFLISNMKTFNRADDQIKAQEIAQKAINTIIDKAIEAKSVTTAGSGNTEQLKLFIDDPNDWVFQYNESTDTLYMNTSPGSSDMVLLATNISSFTAAPSAVGAGTAVQVTLECTVNQSSISVNNTVYLRNQ